MLANSGYVIPQIKSVAGIFTDHFSGPGRAIGPVCECLCVWAINKF